MSAPQPFAERGRVAPQQFLDPDVLARIGNLEWIAKVVVDGFVSGLHKAVFRGSSPDFAEYRAYTPGDDIRRVDWRVFARSDRLYVKTFEAETNADVVFVLDASASMAFASGAVSKLDYARLLLASLAHLAGRQRDRVGFMAFRSEVIEWLPTSARHRRNVLHALARVEAREEGDFEPALRRVADLLGRRGVVVVASDFYSPPATVLSALSAIRVRGHEVIAFHILDRAERDLNVAQPAVFQDMETGRRLAVGPAGREHYNKMIADHVDALRIGARDRGIDYRALTSDEPLDETLWFYLSERARMARHPSMSRIQK